MLMRKCPKCGRQITGNGRFCGECGTDLTKCLACGADIKDGASFCSACGRKIENVVLNNTGNNKKTGKSGKKYVITAVAMALTAVVIVLGIICVPAIREKIDDRKMLKKDMKSVKKVVESYLEYNKTGDEKYLKGFIYSRTLNIMEENSIPIDEVFECTYADYKIKSIKIDEKLVGKKAREYLIDLGRNSSTRRNWGSEAELLDNINKSDVESVLLCDVDYECYENPNTEHYHRALFNIIVVTDDEIYPLLENHDYWSTIYFWLEDN